MTHRRDAARPARAALHAFAFLILSLAGLPGCEKPEESQPTPAPASASASASASADADADADASAPAPAPAHATASSAPPAAPDALFSDATARLGITNAKGPYPDGTYMTPEITPGGTAVFDADGDGRLDILVICHPSPGPFREAFASTAPNRLFRQQPDDTFREVPGAAGLAGKGFHHGVAVGDVNNDGRPDVYVCNFAGPDELFLNNGDGTFADATARSGFPTAPAPDNWSSTAAFFDYDADGHLDLFVTRFATFDARKICQSSTDPRDRDYCGPHTFPGQLASLWRNNGDGTFREVTKQAGIDTPGRGWGVIAADLTGDGLPDVLQANDEEPNQLWVNQGDGKFIDEAAIRGCAFNAAGNVEANMGVAIGDTQNQGVLDFYITHISGETNTLFKADPASPGTYTDVTSTAGMAAIDRAFTGWGAGFLDYDNDGFLDLAVANGRVAKGPVRPEADVGPFWNRYAEPNLLFRGDGTGHFADVSSHAGTFANRLDVHRALAFADLSNRGAVDMVTVSLDNTVRVFRNESAPRSGNHWLAVLPMTGKREALGAIVTLVMQDQKRRTAACLRAYSYLSSNDPKVHFGLGKNDKPQTIEVNWPSGTPRKERFDVPGVDRVLVVEQGKGTGL
jgi:hypothetical protein